MAGSLVVRELLTKMGFDVDSDAMKKIDVALKAIKDHAEQAAGKTSDLGQKIHQMSKEAVHDLEAIQQQEKIFGAAMDANRAAADRLKQAIVRLTNEGVQANDARMRPLIDAYRKFNAEADRTAAKSSKVRDGLVGMGKQILGLAAAYIGFNKAKEAAWDFAEFDAKMRESQSFSKATAQELQALKKVAIDMGVKSGLGAQQAAAGLIELASAGFSVKESIEALPGVLQLARAGGVDVAAATELAAGTVRGFGMTTKDTGHVVDVLAQAAGISAIRIQDLALTMKYVAPVAGAAGQSLEEMSTLVAVMGNRLVKGEQAGTTMRSMFQHLVKPSKEAAAEMQKINLKIADQRGKMLPLTKIIDQVRKGTSKMTQVERLAAVATIFGTEAQSGILAALNLSSQAYEEQRGKIMSAAGAGKTMSDIMNAGPKAAFIDLKNRIEAVSLSVLEDYEPAMTKALRLAGKWVTSAGQTKAGDPGIMGTLLSGADFVGPKLMALGKLIGDIFTSRPVVAFGELILNLIGGAFKTAGAIIGHTGALIYRIVTEPRNTIAAFRDFFVDIFTDIKNFVAGIIEDIVVFFTRAFDSDIPAAAQRAGDAIKRLNPWGHPADTAATAAGSMPARNGMPGPWAPTTNVTVNVTDPKHVRPVVAGAASGASSGLGQARRLAGAGGR